MCDKLARFFQVPGPIFFLGGFVPKSTNPEEKSRNIRTPSLVVGTPLVDDVLPCQRQGGEVIKLCNIRNIIGTLRLTPFGGRGLCHGDLRLAGILRGGSHRVRASIFPHLPIYPFILLSSHLYWYPPYWTPGRPPAGNIREN